ncbi:MAG: hypothetical protein ACXWPM_03410 [Bdellovibrionota bacterium]
MSPVSDPTPAGDASKQLSPCSKEFLKTYKAVFQKSSEMLEAEKDNQARPSEAHHQKLESAIRDVCDACNLFQSEHSSDQCTAPLKAGGTTTLSGNDATLASYCQSAQAALPHSAS